ncbi:MAG: cupin domain-containing protein [Lachnospiraceae bacterium]|nr:cupin domain-containing protein [Lachnospiraceae bacterium]
MALLKMLKESEQERECWENCHDGIGTLYGESLLTQFDPKRIQFINRHIMARGTSIGEHAHNGEEEVYYLVEGSGILIFDGEEYPFEKGDISLVRDGHSHGFISTAEEAVLLVICA